MQLGLIKWFDKEKGFGVVENTIEGEFFFHINNFNIPPDQLLKATALIFIKKIDNRGRKSAVNCRLIGELNDWNLIMQYLDKKSRINIEVRQTGRGYRRNTIESVDIKTYSTHQLFKKLNESEIYQMIVEYFDNDLDEYLFIDYCDFINDRIEKSIDNEIGKNLIFNIFKYFGENLTHLILFKAWKNEKLEYIGYEQELEFEIPEATLKLFKEEISVEELKRIKNFSYGNSFCNEISLFKLNNLNNESSDNLVISYDFLNFVENSNKIHYKNIIDKLLSEKLFSELIQEANSLGPINNSNDLNKYNNLKLVRYSQIEDDTKNLICKEIDKIIISKSSNEYKIELWINGILDDLSFDLIRNYFQNNDNGNEKRLAILSKLEFNLQYKLLSEYIENDKTQESFVLFEKLINKEILKINNPNLSLLVNKILNKFSFKIYNSVERFKDIFSEYPLTVEVEKQVTENIDLQSNEIGFDKLIQIFTTLKNFNLIRDHNHLLELMERIEIVYEKFDIFIKLIPSNFNINILKAIIKNNYKKLFISERITIIEKSLSRPEVMKILIDDFFVFEDDNFDRQFDELIIFLKQNSNILLNNYFLDKYHQQLSLKNPIEIFKIAFISNHKSAQKESIQNLKFNSEGVIIDFIDFINTNNINDDVIGSNIPLKAFIEFIKSSANHFINDDCKIFLKKHNGLIQCLTVKFLIHQLHLQNITKIRLIELLNTFEWTEISAVLLKVLVEESNSSEKLILEKLSQFFKSHFEILAINKFDKASFLDNFTIKNILNKCNGRRQYDAEYWQKNGTSRWYIKDGVRYNLKEAMNCYCEGRPWKKEFLWDANNNTPSNLQYEFYWCRNSYCAQRNDLYDLTKPYNSWTISEISNVLNLNIEKLALATLSGWANRMNQIVNHLFCRSCNEVLRPLPFRPSTLGYYAVPLFHCVNDKCSDNKTIRFTHCLNGKCESHKTSEPLDSRDCENCNPNDLNHTGLQCNYCDSSCPVCSGYITRVRTQESW